MYVFIFGSLRSNGTYAFNLAYVCVCVCVCVRVCVTPLRYAITQGGKVRLGSHLADRWALMRRCALLFLVPVEVTQGQIWPKNQF